MHYHYTVCMQTINKLKQKVPKQKEILKREKKVVTVAVVVMKLKLYTVTVVLCSFKWMFLSMFTKKFRITTNIQRKKINVLQGKQ